MIVINFGHPLTADHLTQLTILLGNPTISNVKEIKCQVNPEDSFADQAGKLVESVGYTSTQWQSLPFVIVPPGLSPLACAVVAFVCGRTGYLPAIARMKQVGGTPPKFEVAEVMNLQSLREEARKLR